MDLRPYFITPAIALGGTAFVLSAINAFGDSNARWQWEGAFTASTVFIGVFLWIGIGRPARLPRYLPQAILPGLAGALLAGAGALFWDNTTNILALICAIGIGVVLLPLYVFWYSRLPREEAIQLTPGRFLPEFSLKDLDGKTVHSDSFRGRPSFFLFYRGNWCPLCMAQIKEIAARYQELEQSGTRVALVSNQSHENTQKLAARYDVPFSYFTDPGLHAAKELGLMHPKAVPFGLQKKAHLETSDAYFPTVVITDAHNKILLADQTDNYRVRPDPGLFLEVIDQAVHDTKKDLQV